MRVLFGSWRTRKGVWAAIGMMTTQGKGEFFGISPQARPLYSQTRYRVSPSNQFPTQNYTAIVIRISHPHVQAWSTLQGQTAIVLYRSVYTSTANGSVNPPHLNRSMAYSSALLHHLSSGLQLAHNNNFPGISSERVQSSDTRLGTVCKS